MAKWYFTVVFEMVGLPDFMMVEEFFDEQQPVVKFPLKDYRIRHSNFISATKEMQIVELFIDFATNFPFNLVIADFDIGQHYYFMIGLRKQTFKVCGKVMDMYYPDSYDPYYHYKVLTSRDRRLRRD